MAYIERRSFNYVARFVFDNMNIVCSSYCNRLGYAAEHPLCENDAESAYDRAFVETYTDGQADSCRSPQTCSSRKTVHAGAASYDDRTGPKKTYAGNHLGTYTCRVNAAVYHGGILASAHAHHCTQAH